MGAVSQITQSVSNVISDLGKEISKSPIAQAALTVGGAMIGVPPAVTAGVLGANQASQTGNLVQGLTTGGLSYLGGNAAAGMMGGSTAAGTAAGATNMGSGATGLQLGANSTVGLNAGNLGNYTLGSSLGSGAAAGGLTGTAATTGMMGAGTSGLVASGLGNYVLGTPLGGSATAGGLLGTLGNKVVDGVTNAVLGGGSGTAGTGAAGQGMDIGGLIGIGANLAGGYLNNQAAADAATKQANATIEAAKIAAAAQKFKPVGVTTRFGSSNFGYDANGNLTSAGYTLTPEMKAQQDKLMAASGGMLNQFTGAQAATAPMATAAQRAMTLGNQYLMTSPQAQAQKYMADQQALLSAGRATDLANIRSNLAATGRTGLMVGGDAGMMAANPELNAYYNSLRQQDLGLAAQATQGGMDYARFGLDTVGQGGNMLSSMYGVQTNAFNPYQTALGGAQNIENMGQGAMDIGTSIGAQSTTANANAGRLLGAGMTNAANTIGQQEMAAGSPWGNLLMGGSNALSNYKFGA